MNEAVADRPFSPSRARAARAAAGGGKGMFQREVAARLGVSPTLVSHWEAGRQPPARWRLERYAQTLGVEVSDLLEPAAAEADETTPEPEPAAADALEMAPAPMPAAAPADEGAGGQWGGGVPASSVRCNSPAGTVGWPPLTSMKRSRLVRDDGPTMAHRIYGDEQDTWGNSG